MMAPMIPMEITPKYIKLASLFSDPIMPTAPFTQTRRNTVASATPPAALYATVPPFLAINSYARPVPNRRTPATTKSARSQTTSSVYCIAIKGSSNMIPVAMARRMAALYAVFPVFITLIILFTLCHQDSDLMNKLTENSIFNLKLSISISGGVGVMFLHHSSNRLIIF